MPTAATSSTATRRSWTPDDLLDATLPYVTTTSLAAVTLRGAASSIGTSHKVLLHHFGSREGFLAATLRRVRGRLIAETRSDDPVATLRAMWAWYRSESPESRVLSQGLGLALADPDTLGRLTEDMLSQYDVLTDGRDPALVRLVQAAVRGLLVEGQVVGDWERADRSFGLLVGLVESVLASERGGSGAVAPG